MTKKPKSAREYYSVARWPEEVDTGTETKESIDGHASREAAAAVCALLRRDGFGGQGKVFPLYVWVEDAEGWRYGKPPNEELVLVELGGEIIKAFAFYGRDGYRPHWKTEDKTRSFPSHAFTRWRDQNWAPRG